MPGFLSMQTSSKKSVNSFQIKDIFNLKKTDHLISQFTIIKYILQFDMLEVNSFFIFYLPAFGSEVMIFELNLLKLAE